MMASATRRGLQRIRRVLSFLLGLALSAAAVVLLGAPMGSLAIALPVERETVVAGDVIIFTAPIGPQRRVIHRVTHVYTGEETQQFVDWVPTRSYMDTKGDNNPSADPWVLTMSDATVWRKESVVMSAGWPAIWLGDPQIRFAAFGLAGLAVVAWSLVVVWRRPQGHTRE
jgi:signal peptidase